MDYSEYTWYIIISVLHGSTQGEPLASSPEPCDEDKRSPSLINKHCLALFEAEAFLNQKLELVKVKQYRTETSGTHHYSVTTNTSIQHSNAEKRYTESCLRRLKRAHVEQCSSIKYTPQRKHFIGQFERLKVESLMHRMKTQIKVGVVCGQNAIIEVQYYRLFNIAL